MLALGVTLLATVAAAPAPGGRATEKLASTYDEASCDASDGGECADEALIELMPPPPAILDCQSPFIADMIGSCDLPAPTIPMLHVPTLRKGGNGLSVAARVGAGERLSVVTASPSVDAALPLPRFAVAPTLHATPLDALASTRFPDAPRSRLDRPPRA